MMISSFRLQLGMIEGEPRQHQRVAERRRLGAGLHARIGVGHAQHAEASREEEERADQDEDTADQLRHAHSLASAGPADARRERSASTGRSRSRLPSSQRPARQQHVANGGEQARQSARSPSPPGDCRGARPEDRLTRMLPHSRMTRSSSMLLKDPAQDSARPPGRRESSARHRPARRRDR